MEGDVYYIFEGKMISKTKLSKHLKSIISEVACVPASNIKNSTNLQRNLSIDFFVEDIVRIHKDRFNILKKINRPKIGWVSIYTPEEVIYAAGLVPFRITGEESLSDSQAKAAITTNFCPYILSCLEEGLRDIYSFIEGVVIVNTCDARRRLYDVWKFYVNNKYNYLIDFPRVISPISKKYFRRQIELFIKSLEKHLGYKIAEDSLTDAIILWNKTRELLKRLYDLRKKKEVFPFRSSQVINIVKASQAGCKKDFNSKLSILLDVMKRQKSVCDIRKKRILLCGSYFDQTKMIDFIESLDAVVVCEDLSNGLKYFEGKVSLKEGAISGLADYYLEKAIFARMIDAEKRFNHLWRIIEDYKIQAVIYFSLKFCDTNLMDFPYQKNRLNERGVSVLFLEGERFMENIEQIKTRIQAFLETQHCKF